VAAALAPAGRFVSIADHPLPDVPGARRSYVQENATDLAHLAKLIDTHELRLRIADRFPLDDVRTAHERFETAAPRRGSHHLPRYIACFADGSGTGRLHPNAAGDADIPCCHARAVRDVARTSA
jgi:hypothetical protein